MEAAMIEGTRHCSQRTALYRDTSRILAFVLCPMRHRDMFPDVRLDTQEEIAIHEIDKI